VKNSRRDLARWTPALIVAAIAIGYGFTLRIFYPGVMTYDARYIHNDSLSGTLGDWQSPVMTVLWAAIDPIAPGSVSMFLLIATTYWLGFAVLSFAIARRSAKAALAMSVIALAPPALVLVGTIWRDVLFAVVWILSAALALSVAERRDALSYVVRAVALGLVLFGLLLRQNALFAAPILAAYVVWPARFDLRRMALLYAPAVLACYALIGAVYYDVLHAKRQNALHSVLVFDLGGITHFAKQNQFPIAWSANEEAQLIDGCYQPAAWDYYWTMGPCTFVMARLENEKVFGSPVLVDAWRRAVTTHPIAYLQHRLAAMGRFLFGDNTTMWTVDIENPDRPLFGDNPWFVAIRHVDGALRPTPLFRAATWLMMCVVLCAFAWARRDQPLGAFVVGVSGSAIVYMMTFLPFGVAADFRYAYFSVLAGLTAGVVAPLLRPITRPVSGISVPAG
jgi:hypothetical protein